MRRALNNSLTIHVSQRRGPPLSCLVHRLRLCFDAAIPVIPFGAGTSLEGQISVPSDWPFSLCIDLSKMDKIVAIRGDDLDATVQPGVGWQELNAVCKPVCLAIIAVRFRSFCRFPPL